MNQPTMQLPAHLADLGGRALAKHMAENFGTSALPPHISIRDNRFRMIDAAGNEAYVPTFDPQLGPYMDAVILDVGDHVSRLYYSKPFDGSDAPPDCFSDNGVGPSAQATNPQSMTCATCDKARWGSATSKITGKGIPACASGIKLALLLPAVPGMLFMLRVPPNSIDNARDYGKMVAGKGLELHLIVTRISFEPNVQGTLRFAPVDWAPPSIAPKIKAAIDGHATDDLVGRKDVPRTAALPAPQQPVAQPQPQQVQQPAPQAFQPPPQTVAQPSFPQPAPQTFQGAPQQPFPAAPGPQAFAAAAPQEAAPAKPKRGPKPKAEQPAAPQAFPAAAPSAAEDLSIPEFLRRSPAPAAAQMAPQQQAGFGVIPNAPGPSPELENALAAAFALPTS